MSFALGFAYFYVAGGLIVVMCLLKEMRRKNEEDGHKHEDYAIAGAVILIAAFWLPIALALFAFCVAIFAYDWLSSIRA